MDDEGGAPDTLQDGSRPAPRKRTQKAVGDNFASRGEVAGQVPKDGISSAIFAAPSEYASTNYPVPYDPRMKGIKKPYPEHAVDGGAFLVMDREELGSVGPLEAYVEHMEIGKIRNPETYGP